MRILVTGSREFTSIEAVRAALLEMTEGHSCAHVLVEGGARGADALAAEVARSLNWAVETYKAEWGRHDMECPPSHRGQDMCRRAGHRRNARMVSLGADVCVAFYKRGAANKGTAHCAQAAGRAGIPVSRVVA